MTTVTSTGAPEFPTVSGAIPPTEHETMDAAIQTLNARKDAWVALGVPERIAIIDAIIRDVAAVADRWVETCLKAKGIAPDAPAAGEEWSNGPYSTMKELRQFHQSLVDIAGSGHPHIPGPVTTRADGQVVARVFPQNTYDKIIFTGVTAEIWMQPDVTERDLASTQAVNYHDHEHEGKVSLVLGAGNVSSIGPLDALYKLLVDDEVVILKTNPINSYLGPIWEEGLKALIEPGYLRIVHGGSAEGAYLCNHPGISDIHITGSDKTFDAIVFGTGPEGAARKAANTPLLDKPITGELGNVSPVIVVPGPWSASDITYQAEHLATMLTNNAGFNCNATRTILTYADWPQRNELLNKLRDVLAKVPLRDAFYPGARERFQAFAASHPEAEQFGRPAGDELSWMLIPGVTPENADDITFTTEAFCGIFAETPLQASSVAEYIDKAVAFCNQQLWGTLNATILVHPASQKDPGVAEAIKRGIAQLRYGSVAVNYWAATSYAIGATTWGAFPGHAVNDIQSGTGVVHNTLMFSRPQKSVLYAPFRALPVPVWFVSHGTAAKIVFRKLTALEANPSPLKVPSIVVTALRG
jgi:acyl-CoA reductase-like NAD-dependent aldehyde dehydrogenase